MVLITDEKTTGTTDPTRGLLANAKNRVAAITESSPGAKKVANATKLVTSEVSKRYDQGRRVVSQADAWQETEATVETLVDVVRTQHGMILDLLDRVSRLEAAPSHDKVPPEAEGREETE